MIDPETGEKELWAVQYRIRPLLYCLVVEGVLDCITLRRFGVPAVSTFQGNDTARTWNLDSNKSVRGITGILVVPDNDGLNGDVIALSKLNDIPRSSPLRLPDEFKDAGKMIEKYLPLGEDAVREALDKWLYPRPLIGDL